MQAALVAVLLLAAGLRLWGVTHDLPFSYFGDELHWIKRSMALGTGDLNPHWFHKPAFFMYVLLGAYGLFFAAGLALGRFESTAEFGAYFLTTSWPFLLIARLLVCAAGIATVWVVWRIARRAVAGRSRAEAELHGLSAALVAAVLVPMVASSQHVKTDVPCALLMALSVWAFLGTRDSERLRPLAAAALLAGAAMGTHYYAIVLVPTYCALELARLLPFAAALGARPLPPRAAPRVLGRCALVVLLFGLAFFLTSPYNFLDPTWARQTAGHLRAAMPSGEGRFEPDEDIVFDPGLAGSAGALRHFLGVMTSRGAMGWALTLLAALGLAVTVGRRETRWYGLLVLLPAGAFCLVSITAAAYHAEPRHLNAVYPLLATLVWPAARLLTAPLRRLGWSERRRTAAAFAVVAAAALPSAVAAAQENRRLTRLDSRLVAYRWIQEHLPRDARLLVDDYGPTLQPDPRAVARLERRLATIPPGPFTEHQATRLDLLRRYPPPGARDLDELGHPWWLPREKSDAELAASETDRDMGNPLTSRQPRPLAEYRRQGVRYVITNSVARSRYWRDRRRVAEFPSFVRFYEELPRSARRIATFDPKRWDGKGPVVWIYDLAAAPRPAPAGRRPGR
ncbi:MAG TPA: glycosyltransferase family 39 protein [Thermoanaerobaculia bacterium]|nr:glycosyltransferase family 39 protein [Thermoanaerobaculia bacterium]